MSFPLDQQLTKNQLPKKQMATEFFFTPGKLKISFLLSWQIKKEIFKKDNKKLCLAIGNS